MLYLIQGLLQMRGAHAVSHVPVRRVGQEELPLGRQRCPDVLLALNVLLTAVHHTDVACRERGHQGRSRTKKASGVRKAGGRMSTVDLDQDWARGGTHGGDATQQKGAGESTSESSGPLCAGRRSGQRWAGAAVLGEATPRARWEVLSCAGTA